MRNTWHLFRAPKPPSAAALRRAWSDEKRRNICALIEGRNPAEKNAGSDKKMQDARRIAAMKSSFSNWHPKKSDIINAARR